MKTTTFGALVTGTIAGLVLSASARAEDAKPAAKDAKAEWYCQNSTCKGNSACKGHGNDACHGQNSCKGKGWLEAKDKAECTTKKGKWTKASKH